MSALAIGKQILSNKTFQIVAIAAVVAALIWYAISKAAEKRAARALKASLYVKPNHIPKNPTGSDWDPSTLITRIYTDIYAWNWGRDIGAYSELNSLSDDHIIVAHNYWLDEYFDEDNETLLVAIAGEKDWWFNGTWPTFANLRNSIISRMKNLNLQ